VAPAALAAAAAVTTGVVMAWPHHINPGRPTPSAVITPPPPVDPATQDARFISLLRASGLAFAYAHAAIVEGRGVCARMAGGETNSQIIDDTLTLATPHTPVMQNAATFVDTAITIYCPQVQR
jgi:hypothetical protein